MHNRWWKGFTISGYRRLATIFIGYVAFFVAGNYAVWKLRTQELLTKKFDGGDLVRMGYIHGLKQYRKRSVDLPRRHLEMKDYHGQPVDILVIGDSFSNGGGEGRNSYYQDYLATFNKLTVLNVGPYTGTGNHVMDGNPVSTLAVLYNSGYLDLIRPKCIILESAERFSIARFGLPLRFDATADIADLKKFYRELNYSFDYLPPVGFINEGNFKYYYYNFMYLFSDNAFRGLVYKKRLSVPLFSTGDGRTLLFHGEELRTLSLVTPAFVTTMNDNLNRLSDILGEKGMKLYFMPVVEKSNLYGDFIVDNRFPRSTFFEELRSRPRRYSLIDTKKLLLKRVRNGEKDIFHPDDTHWTWRASEAIFSEVRFDDCCSGRKPGESNAL